MHEAGTHGGTPCADSGQLKVWAPRLTSDGTMELAAVGPCVALMSMAIQMRIVVTLALLEEDRDNFE